MQTRQRTKQYHSWTSTACYLTLMCQFPSRLKHKHKTLSCIPHHPYSWSIFWCSCLSLPFSSSSLKLSFSWSVLRFKDWLIICRFSSWGSGASCSSKEPKFILRYNERKSRLQDQITQNSCMSIISSIKAITQLSCLYFWETVNRVNSGGVLSSQLLFIFWLYQGSIWRSCVPAFWLGRDLDGSQRGNNSGCASCLKAAGEPLEHTSGSWRLMHKQKNTKAFTWLASPATSHIIKKSSHLIRILALSDRAGLKLRKGIRTNIGKCFSKICWHVQFFKYLCISLG